MYHIICTYICCSSSYYALCCIEKTLYFSTFFHKTYQTIVEIKRSVKIEVEVIIFDFVNAFFLYLVLTMLELTRWNKYFLNIF